MCFGVGCPHCRPYYYSPYSSSSHTSSKEADATKDDSVAENWSFWQVIKAFIAELRQKPEDNSTR